MRRLNRLVALVLGLAVAAAAVLAGIETMLLILGQAPLVVPRSTWARELRAASWSSTGIDVTSVVLIAVGVVLVVMQLVPRRPVRLGLRSRSGQRVWLSRRGLIRRLGHDVDRLEDVRAAKVRVGRKRVKAKVVLAVGASRDAVVEEVRQVVQTTLTQLGVISAMHVRVKASPTEAVAPAPTEQPS